MPQPAAWKKPLTNSALPAVLGLLLLLTWDRTSEGSVVSYRVCELSLYVQAI